MASFFIFNSKDRSLSVLIKLNKLSFFTGVSNEPIANLIFDRGHEITRMLFSIVSLEPFVWYV